MDAFWSQDIVNEWNDEYSPRKIPAVHPPSMSPKKPASPMKLDRVAMQAKKNFSQMKHELAESFLKELDHLITGGQIAEMAASTGGIKIVWSKKLNTTAGRANWRRETDRSQSWGSMGSDYDKIQSVVYRHHATIELAEKVIDDEHRLINVLAHEYCHLANFMISGIKNNPHGKEFKVWAAKVSSQFAHRDVEVTTKHTYAIDYKYVWECSNCGSEYKRHSKSIDPARHKCGFCISTLVQTKPVPRTTTTVNQYQVFVKEHMKAVKAENPGSPQKEIMTLVGKKYQEYKASTLGSEVEGMGDVGVGIEELVGSKEGTPVDATRNSVSRKLNFLEIGRL